MKDNDLCVYLDLINTDCIRDISDEEHEHYTNIIQQRLNANKKEEKKSESASGVILTFHANNDAEIMFNYLYDESDFFSLLEQVE